MRHGAPFSYEGGSSGSHSSGRVACCTVPPPVMGVVDPEVTLGAVFTNLCIISGLSFVHATRRPPQS